MYAKILQNGGGKRKEERERETRTRIPEQRCCVLRSDEQYFRAEPENPRYFR